MYEEITDLPSAFKYTQCPVYGMSMTSSTTVQVESHHEYEDVKLNNSAMNRFRWQSVLHTLNYKHTYNTVCSYMCHHYWLPGMGVAD